MYNLGSHTIVDNEIVKIELKINKLIIEDGQMVILYDVVTHDKIADQQNKVTKDFVVNDARYQVPVVDGQGNPVPVEEGSPIQKTIGNFDYLYRTLFVPFIKTALEDAMKGEYLKQPNPLTYVETGNS